MTSIHDTNHCDVCCCCFCFFLFPDDARLRADFGVDVDVGVASGVSSSSTVVDGDANAAAAVVRLPFLLRGVILCVCVVGTFSSFSSSSVISPHDEVNISLRDANDDLR